MNRREFLIASAAGAGVATLGLEAPPAARAAVRARRAAGARKGYTNMNICDYLSREARRISDHSLADFRDAAAWKRLIPEKRRQYLEMMGMPDLAPAGERPAVPVSVAGVLERPGYRIERLSYEALPKLYVTANLYLPAGDTPHEPPFPGVLYVCGHSTEQKVHYQPHPRRWAQLGFACLIVETIERGEFAGTHHGCYSEGWFQWYSRGYSPAATEMLTGIRGLDLLAARPEVNADRLGVTGISGGGAATWWIAAGDERVKAAAPVCGTATLASQIYDRTIDGHCDCMWPINTTLWDLADVGALIAPRPLLIASANRDGIFTIAAIREVHAQLARLYGKLGAESHLKLVETPGEHSYHEHSRTAIFSWFAKHLQGKEIPPERIGDIDQQPEHQEPAAALRVFTGALPAGNRALTIQDDLVPLAKPPAIADAAGLEQERRRVAAALREKTFRAFPAKPPALDPQIEYEDRNGATTGCRFAFTSEEGWRLHGRLTLADTVKRPAAAVVALRTPGEERGDAERLAGGIRAPWAKVIIEPRGTGETAWGEELQWHLRRAAAWTGRTLASMRVWDVLRALQALRTLPDVDGKQVALAARGEMAAVALYAGLLDGQISAVFLEDPPATQNAGSEKNGRGPAIEMLNCLRITDLPQVAGLLWPARLVVAGEVPETYRWAEDLYGKLGAPGRLERVGKLGEWRA